MCTDYHSLNSNTVSDSWPLPRIDEMLARLKGARFFSKLDLREGYHRCLLLNKTGLRLRLPAGMERLSV